MKFKLLNLDDRIEDTDFQSQLIADWKRGYLVGMPYFHQWGGWYIPTPSTVIQAAKRYRYLVSKGVEYVAVSDTDSPWLTDGEATEALKKLLLKSNLPKVAFAVQPDLLKGGSLQCWEGKTTRIIVLTYKESRDNDIAELQKAGLEVTYCKPSALGYCYMIEHERGVEK